MNFGRASAPFGVRRVFETDLFRIHPRCVLSLTPNSLTTGAELQISHFYETIDLTRVRQYLTELMKTTVSSKGQIVLPAALRLQDRIEPGEEFEVERLDRGEYRLVRLTTWPNEGLVDWLLACPEKGFFVPIESESTDTL